MRRPDVLDAFSYPRFRRVWLAGLVSQLGDWMQIIGRALLAYRLTGSAQSVGFVYFATYAPQMIFSLWGGVLADRFDRRLLVIATNVAQAIGAVAMGLLVVTGTASVLNITLLSFAIGTATMLNIPAGQALMPTVVPRDALTSAISLGTATSSLARVFGPLLAAGVVGAFGIEWVFWLNALSFVAVIAAWLRTPVPRQPRMEEERNLDAARRAWRFVRSTPAVGVPIGATSFLMLVGIVYQPLMVVFATKVLAEGSKSAGRGYFGWLQAGVGVGAVIGVLGLAGIGRRRPSPTFAITAIGYSLSLALLGFTTSAVPALLVITLVGTFHFANMALAINLVQHEVPEEMRGRVMSIHMTGLIGTVPITALVGAALADELGVAAVLSGSGVLCLVFSLVLTLKWRRHIRVAPVEAESPETAAAMGTLIEEEA